LGGVFLPKKFVVLKETSPENEIELVVTIHDGK
jgi:hypothetical protein